MESTINSFNIQIQEEECNEISIVHWLNDQNYVLTARANIGVLLKTLAFVMSE